MCGRGGGRERQVEIYGGGKGRGRNIRGGGERSRKIFDCREGLKDSVEERDRKMRGRRKVERYGRGRGREKEDRGVVSRYTQ